MSEDNPKQIRASFDFDRRFMRKGKHSVFLWLPKEYHASIGLIVAYWGNFEAFFDICLNALIEGETGSGFVRDTTGWRRLPYKKRRRLLKDICAEWLSPMYPQATERIVRIVDQSASLHAKRNLLAHGRYTYTIPAYSSVATNCRAINPDTGAEMPFDELSLKKLYHDISHLTADLFLAFKEIGEVSGPFHAFPDTEILRIYRETNHPWNPNPSKRTPLPEASHE
jgi:hypothetical protein